MRETIKQGTIMLRGDKKYIKTRRGVALYWSPEMLYYIKKYFADTNNDELAEMCGVSNRTLTRKARELGLWKSEAFIERRNKIATTMCKIINRTVGNKGQFKKGYSGGRKFQKGEKPFNIKKVIRLDTLQVYESGTALARAIGVTQSSIAGAIRRNGKCRGIAVMLYDDYQRMQERVANTQRPVWERTKQVI